MPGKIKLGEMAPSLNYFLKKYDYLSTKNSAIK